jgi:DNA-binding transcriptional MerR regulator
VARLTIGEAAARLHTAPSTIRSWEQRLGYPTPVRTTSGRRLYDDAEIALLSDALRRGLSISSAIREIQEETGHQGTLLRRALAALDFERCDALLEAAIALRGISRAFDEVVLGAVEGVVATGDDVGVAVQWTQDRACWARRRACVRTTYTVVMVDGSPHASSTRAACYVLQLQLALRSVQTLTLLGPESSAQRSVSRRLDADCVVFAGNPPPCAYRGTGILAARLAGFRTEGDMLHASVEVLPSQPRAAAEQVLGAKVNVSWAEPRPS